MRQARLLAKQNSLPFLPVHHVEAHTLTYIAHNLQASCHHDQHLVCCRLGVRKARLLAKQHSLPFLPVHHMEAHALTVRQARSVAFPYLTLLVSGGHTMLLMVHGVGNYTLLGSSLDDSVGAHLRLCSGGVMRHTRVRCSWSVVSATSCFGLFAGMILWVRTCVPCFAHLVAVPCDT